MATGLSSYDSFGYSVSINAEYILVGAYADDDLGSAAGTAYIFKNDGNDNFNEIAQLFGDDTDAGDYFGYSVDIYGEYAVIGAIMDKSNEVGLFQNNLTGSAYIFKNDGSDSFNQIAKLYAEDTNSGSFGTSVAIENNIIAIGDTFGALNDSPHRAGGAVYVYNITSNNQVSKTAKLVPLDGDSHDLFGSSVDISGEYIVVGAEVNSWVDYGDDRNRYPGSAYLFKNNSEILKLEASESYIGDDYGTSIAIDDNTVVVGAPSNYYVAPEQTGHSYIFELSSMR